MRLLQVSLVFFLLLGLTGCYKEDKDKCPGHATLIVTADWSERGADEGEPEGFTVRVAENAASVVGLRCEFPHPIAPGDCHVNAHTTPERVTINGDVATVAASRAGTIDPMPGCLFTWSHSLVGVKKGDEHHLTALMKQQMRMLTIVIESAGGITSQVASATLNLDGVASSINIATEALSAPAAVSVPFEANLVDDTMEAKAKLLGVLGSNMLTLDFVFVNDETQQLSIDLTSRLANFNTDKKMKETITISIEEVDQVTGEILDWTVKGGYTGNAD